ncbi:diacylglycerol kinase family protein [Nocardioides sp. zg-1228]|uniref:diacylglycerol/lipid kinase family protein n=1 Tax=Nocardioides sp. zg-1228 TaxID=2763008 RepID=UPI0016432D62|nr:YegS/Rv2252/BmrU family lipid kinase [Nocardioides sp. zg-1228]MBC2931735.1 YegS/Rv2252/BmrU family lipid kinase [Nocardioides sp. zg-1228]QSF57320.1 YegS/Rv2252/BmrU family lipid kinase [Nocardioides sp. zg-1228]
MRSLLVITNAEAGTSDEARLAQALDALRDKASVEVAKTSNPGELDGVLHRAGGRTVVVAGGDGSLHAVVTALHKRRELDQATLALLPMGTGNDFARGNDIPLDIEDAARLVLSGEPRPVDLIVDETGNVVVNNVHVGVGAQASRKGHKWKSRLGAVGVGKANLGKLGYPIGALLSAFDPPAWRLHVEVDGEVVNDVDRPVLMVAIGNGAKVGGGTDVNPDADTEDGLLDVMVSRAVGPSAKLGYVLRLRKGEHDERDDVLTLRGKSVKVSGDEFWLSADGEISGPERTRSWRLERGAYTMILPR